MNAVEKEKISKEAEMQIKALKTINLWKTIAIAVSTLGVAAAYAGIAGTSRSLFLGILGVIIMLIGLVSALILNLGLKNGRRNVEMMLNILDKEKVS